MLLEYMCDVCVDVCVFVHGVCTACVYFCISHVRVCLLCVDYICVMCAMCMRACVCELHAHVPVCVKTWQTRLVQRECQVVVCFFQVET